MNYRAGLKAFGSEAIKAIKKEMKQLHQYNCVTPRSDLSWKQKRGALEYLMKLKQKKDGSIKGRGCADGSKQHPLSDDTSSPTVSTKALFISCVIDAHEGRDIATVDIPGAFLQAHLKENEEIFMVLRGKMAELLCAIDPENTGRTNNGMKRKENTSFIQP